MDRKPASAIGTDASPARLGVFGALWLFGLIIGPVFGYFLTRIIGWITPENWRTMMMIRISACFLWPVIGALLNGLVGQGRRSGWTLTNTMAISLVSGFMIYPAWNAFQDLRHGPEQVELRVTDKDASDHHNRHTRYTAYELSFSDGNSYPVTEDLYHRVHASGSCVVTRLHATNILLDLRSVGAQ